MAKPEASRPPYLPYLNITCSPFLAACFRWAQQREKAALCRRSKRLWPDHSLLKSVHDQVAMGTVFTRGSQQLL